MSAQRVTVRLDRITIEGTRLSRAGIARALEREFAALLAEPGRLEGLRSARAMPRLNGGRIAPKAGGDAAFGRAIAQAAMGAIRR